MSRKFTPANIEQLRQSSSQATVDYLHELPTYADFFSNYLLPNRPCVFSPQATESWRSRCDWVTSEGTPSTDFLNDEFGSATVPVADCSQEEYSAQPKQDWTLSEYLQYWRHRGDNQDSQDRCLYLKDWHFTRSFSEYNAYSTPVYFCSDWLNEFWDSRQDGGDDYRFVYIGPKGSWTPFHADVFRSYSWSANICGRKKWVLFPPGEERCLTDVHGQLAYDIESSELSDEARYPDYAKLRHKVEVFQEAGEIIFVPSGWHHQVYNVEDTISINHNWMNGCNIDLCWGHIKKCLQDVEKEIADCRDMDGWHKQCQLILKASSGIDYSEFLHFLLTIAQHRLHALGCKPEEVVIQNCRKMAQNKEDCFVVGPDVMENSLSDAAVRSPCECAMESKDLEEGACTIPQLTFSSDSVFAYGDGGGHKSESKYDNSEKKCDNSERKCDNESKCDNGESSCDNIESDGRERKCDISEIKCDGSRKCDGSESKCALNISVLDLAVTCADYTGDPDKYKNAHWRFCDTSHAKFDLARVRDILEDIFSLSEFKEIGVENEILKARNVCFIINSILFEN